MYCVLFIQDPADDGDEPTQAFGTTEPETKQAMDDGDEPTQAYGDDVPKEESTEDNTEEIAITPIEEKADEEGETVS